VRKGCPPCANIVEKVFSGWRPDQIASSKIDQPREGGFCVHDDAMIKRDQACFSFVDALQIPS
jgi:hypothetical protein